MKIQLDSFGGVAPKVAPHLLPADAASVAQNCRWGAGSLTPWQAPLFTSGLGKSGTKKALYLFHDQYWFHWLSDVDCRQGPIAADGFERTYFTGAGLPAYTLQGFAETGGGTTYPNNWYTLGVPAPPAFNVAVAGELPETPDVTLYESKAYVATYVTAYGEEGPPSPPTGIVSWYPGQHMELSDLPGMPEGNYHVTQLRLYRSNTGSSGTEFQLVDTIAVGTTGYTDAKSNEQLKEILPSTEWDAPPADLAGLTELPNGSFAGFSGKELCISVPYLPHAWPTSWRCTTAYPIVALAVYGNNLLVLTTGLPYLGVISDPSSVVLERVETGLSCVAKRGVVDAGDAVFYPSPEGLIAVGMAGIRNVTEVKFTQTQWLAFNPASFSAYYYEGHYLAFYDDGETRGGLIIDGKTGEIGTTDVYATAGYHHKKSGKLYLVVEGSVVEWNGGSTALTRVWESKTIETAAPVSFGIGKFDAKGPVTVRLFANWRTPNLVEELPLRPALGSYTPFSATVQDDTPFRLPSGFSADKWRIRIEGEAVVSHAILATTVGELAR